MKLHRFYTGNKFELAEKILVRDGDLHHQWTRVLRFKPNQRLVLFDGAGDDRLYEITAIDRHKVTARQVASLTSQTPRQETYLLWSLLKKDNNDWILQKATELGVRHFWPIMADRSQKTGFSVERAERIVVEASEQCWRSDIPVVREPTLLTSAIQSLAGQAQLYVCEQGSQMSNEIISNQTQAVLVGPEGGWSEAEMKLFTDLNLPKVSLGRFTLRAETAALAAVVSIMPS